MKKIINYLYLILFNIFVLLNFISYTSANSDYVCSRYQTACNCTRETDRRNDGTKRCIGTTTVYTRYGNTRIGCPSNSRAFGTVAFDRTAGQFRYGDVKSYSNTCELVIRDTTCPQVSLTKQLIQEEYQEECPTQPQPSQPLESIEGGESETNDEESQEQEEPDIQMCTYTKDVGYKFTATCNDLDPDGKNGSGCTKTTDAKIVKFGQLHLFKFYDKAGNQLSISTDGKPGKCNSVQQFSFDTTGSCISGSCLYSDRLPPIDGQVNYSPSSCTNTGVAVTAICTADAGNSGCYKGVEKTNPEFIYTNQSGTIGIRDLAGNAKTDLPWSVDWIDPTAPTNLTFYAGDGSQLASSTNIFTISARDTTANSCVNTLEYTINITGPENKVIKGVTSNNGLPNAGTLGLTKAGDYSFVVTVKDGAGNTSTKTYSNHLTIYPNNIDDSKTQISLVQSRDSIYATYEDSYTYNIKFFDQYNNPIYSKSINSISYVGNKIIYTNNVEKTGLNSLNFTLGDMTDSTGRTSFALKSLAPGVYEEKFKISVPVWGDDYENKSLREVILDTSKDNSFKKPFKGSFSVLTSPYILTVGIDMNIRLNIESQFSNTPTYLVQDFSNLLSLSDTDNHFFDYKDNFANFTSHPTFDARIGIKTDDGYQINPNIYLDPNPYIEYTLKGQLIKYHLTAQDEALDMTNIKGEGDEILGVKIVGMTQAIGKQGILDVYVNNSNISVSQVSSEIRTQVLQSVRSYESGVVTNGIKYVNGNETIKSNTLPYHTLVVENGNVTIDSNLNTAKNKLGIIVLRTNKDDSVGHIYVKPGVTSINAFLYADGSLLSVNNDGTEFGTNTDRSTILSKQLIINGSIISKNTIGGSLLGTSGTYTLPGGATTTSLQEALKYDLNYFRVGNNGCDKNDNKVCTDPGEYENPTVVIYSNQFWN
ncbi:MAG: hypothetical protein V3575_06135 [Candidatus Absconditabacteria bacterium]